MHTLFRYIHLALAAVVLTGCATAGKQAYQAPSEPIKTVLIVAPKAFPKVTVGIGGNVGLMFGGVGAVAATYDHAERGGALHQAVTGKGANYDQQLINKIKSGLAAAGIQSHVIAVERPGRTTLLDDYRPLAQQRKADAVLDLFVAEAGYGGTHPIFDRELRPILRVSTRLVSTKDFNTLYSEDVSFGYSNPFMPAVEIKSPKEYYFPNLEAAIGEYEKAAEGLRVAADTVAQHVVQQFTGGKADAKVSAFTSTLTR